MTATSIEPPPYRVVQFLRNAGSGGFSVERLYSDVRAHLSADISVDLVENRFRSRGVLPRVFDAARAALRQADVNHVTGDVHYLTYFLRKRRTVLTVLDCIALERHRGLKRFAFWLFWYWLPVARASLVVTISEATRQQVIAHCRCAPEKVRVVHCTLSDAFRHQPRPPRSGPPRILHVGSADNKNLEGHVQALKGLDCRLVVIGRLAPAQHRLLEASGLDYEVLTGLSEQELVEEYAKCDLLLFASLYEGFGLPIIEAQAIGRPVITGNCWSMPEVAGDGAVLVDPHKPAEIRSAVQEVLDSPRKYDELVVKGLENCKRFLPSVIAAQYEAVYAEIAASQTAADIGSR